MIPDIKNVSDINNKIVKGWNIMRTDAYFYAIKNNGYDNAEKDL